MLFTSHGDSPANEQILLPEHLARHRHVYSILFHFNLFCGQIFPLVCSDRSYGQRYRLRASIPCRFYQILSVYMDIQ